MHSIYYFSMLLHPAQSYGTRRLPEKWAMPSIPNETTMSRERLSPWGHGCANFMSLPPLRRLQSFKPVCRVKARASLQLNSQKHTLAAFNNAEYGPNSALPKLFSLALSSSMKSVPLSNYSGQTHGVLVILLPAWKPAHVPPSLLS